MIYKCSICGGEVDHVVLTVNPPINRYACRSCGEVKHEPTRSPDPITINMEDKT